MLFRSFKGEFLGTIYDFVTKGRIYTPLGLATTEIRIKIPTQGEPNYEGLLETKNFKIGKLLNNDIIGFVNFNGKISGSSFNAENLKTKLEGNIDSIEVNKYIYTHITTNGFLQKKAYNGLLGIADQNINFTSNVNIDFNQKPKIVALSNLKYANLKALNFSNNEIGRAHV